MKPLILALALMLALFPAAPSAQEPPEGEPEGEEPQEEEPAEPPPAAEPAPQQEPPPPPPPPPAPAIPAVVTLGEFALAVTEGLRLPAPATGFTAESAAWALTQKGIKLRGDLGSPLTEADVVSALTGLGYKVRTLTPSRVVSRDRMMILLETFVTAPAPGAGSS